MKRTLSTTGVIAFFDKLESRVESSGFVELRVREGGKVSPTDVINWCERKGYAIRTTSLLNGSDFWIAKER